MPGPNCLLFPVVSGPLPWAFDLLAYVGLGPGQEFIPYFLALLLAAGTACLAILQWPFLALRRRLARARGRHGNALKDDLATANVPESPDQVTQDKP